MASRTKKLLLFSFPILLFNLDFAYTTYARIESIYKCPPLVFLLITTHFILGPTIAATINRTHFRSLHFPEPIYLRFIFLVSADRGPVGYIMHDQLMFGCTTPYEEERKTEREKKPICKQVAAVYRNLMSQKLIKQFTSSIFFFISAAHSPFSANPWLAYIIVFLCPFFWGFFLLYADMRSGRGN